MESSKRMPSTAPFPVRTRPSQRIYQTLILSAESFETIQKLEKSDPLRDTIKDDIVIDAAWRSLHATTVAVKTLTKSYYGRRHTKSYFSGCGGGGRQGIKAMATFPDDYDGVV